MKTVFAAVIALCICANILPAKTARVKVRCSKSRSGSGVITITKEYHSGHYKNCDDRTYYRIDGTTSQEHTQANYLVQQQKGNPRTLEVVKKIKVGNVCKAEKKAHEVVSDNHFEDKWYAVMPKKDEEFIQNVTEAVENLETFMMFTAMINSFKEATPGPDKEGRFFHFA